MAKKFVKFEKLNNEGCVYIDAYAPIFQEKDLEEVLPQYLPWNKLFKDIYVKNFHSLSKMLLERLTMQYLHGAVIHISNQKANFAKDYKCIMPKPLYGYTFEDLNWSQLPKSIADYKVGNQTIKEILENNTSRYIPNIVWNTVDKIAKKRINDCKEHNKGRYDLAELWYKELFFDYHNIGRKVFSPNEKTFYECMAEIEFAKQVKDCSGNYTITEEELGILHKYASAYGVDIPKFSYRINSRKTDHGYTQEPERVYMPMTDSEVAVAIYDYRNDNLPANVRKGLWHRSVECPKFVKEAYDRLKFYMELGDEFLMPGYKRCPQCGEIYHESRGCENCGGVEALEFLSAENLFYANATAFEDMDATTDFYKGMMSSLEGDDFAEAVAESIALDCED